MCGGAIVSAYYVLTAAHCKRGSIGKISVRAGSDVRGRGGSLHLIDTFETHPNFSQDENIGNSNDIGIVRVYRRFLFDPKVRQPISMFNPNEQIRPNAMAFVVGLGATQRNFETTDGSPAARLQYIIIPVVGKTKCDEYLGKNDRSTRPGVFCTGFERGEVDTCVGDSGGPVIIGGRLAGVVSTGIGCALPESPGLNTEIAFFRDWIDRRSQFWRFTQD